VYFKKTKTNPPLNSINPLQTLMLLLHDGTKAGQLLYSQQNQIKPSCSQRLKPTSTPDAPCITKLRLDNCSSPALHSTPC
jgi:hypothetical protein